jgi:uncharacterized protein (TIGR00299 family) protein
MRILYLDCFSGISGDMAVGALIDAGVPLSVLRDGLATLGLDEAIVRLETRSITRSEITATKLDVVDVERRARWAESRGADDHAREHSDDHEHDHDRDHGHDHPHDHGHAHGHEHAHAHDDAHSHEHEHEHEHAHSHEHEHEHAHSHEQEHAHEHAHAHSHSHGHSHAHEHSHPHEHGHRSYVDIRRMIEASALPERVRRWSVAIFREIGLAEARVHGTDLDRVQFHEVGAVDSIADIVAFALCLDHFEIDEVYSSSIPLGSGGFIETQHGTMPLPAPATLEILKGYPTRLTDVPFELTTPTGAGIIKALSHGPLALDALDVERVGFGAGTRELADRPNLLRAIIARWVDAGEQDVVTLIECNIDDLNPQVYPFLFERLLDAGANDVYLTPVLMKKGRPGHVLSVLAEEARVAELTGIIFAETTTIGVRYSERRRRKLARSAMSVETEFGPVRMKRIESDGLVRTVPELEDARRIAVERGLPLQSVLRRLQEIGSDLR